jgi:hypothetical protein
MRKNIILSFVFLSACVGNVTDSQLDYGYDPSGIDTGLRMKQQEMPNWCWAATSQALLWWQGIERSQCEIASYALAKDCCTSKITCDQGFVISDLQDTNLNYSYISGAMSASEIRRNLFKGNVISIRFADNHVASHPWAHLVSVTGFSTEVRCKEDEFLVQDPANSHTSSCQSYLGLQNLYGKVDWSETYIYGE